MTDFSYDGHVSDVALSTWVDGEEVADDVTAHITSCEHCASRLEQICLESTAVASAFSAYGHVLAQKAWDFPTRAVSLVSLVGMVGAWIVARQADIGGVVRTGRMFGRAAPLAAKSLFVTAGPLWTLLSCVSALSAVAVFFYVTSLHKKEIAS